MHLYHVLLSIPIPKPAGTAALLKTVLSYFLKIVHFHIDTFSV